MDRYIGGLLHNITPLIRLGDVHDNRGVRSSYYESNFSLNLSKVVAFPNISRNTTAEDMYINLNVVLIATLLGVVTLWTAIGNLMVLIALLRYPNLRTTSNMLIGNLALSDFLLAITVLPISVSHDLLEHWIFGRIMCIIWLCIDVLYCTASIWGLCSIALDRYIATIYPMWYHEHKSSTRAWFFIIFVWLLSLVVSLAPFIGWSGTISTLYVDTLDNNRYHCLLFRSKGYVFYSASGSFFIPLALMFFLYARIFVALHRSSRDKKHRAKRYQMYYNKSRPPNSEDPLTQNNTTWESTQENATTPSSASNNDDASLFPNQKSSSAQLTSQNKIEEKMAIECNSKPISTSTTCYTIDSSSVFRDIDTEDGEITVSNSEPINLDTFNAESELDHRGRQFSVTYQPTIQVISNKLTSSMKRRFELREQRATKRMSLIMVCFIVCWLPFFIMYIVRSSCASCSVSRRLQAFLTWLGYINSGLNPILYTIFNRDFKRVFKRIIRRSNRRLAKLTNVRGSKDFSC